MKRSALRGRIAPAGKPAGTVGRGAKSGGSAIASASYRSKKRAGATSGLWGFEKPHARKKGRSPRA
jgi:hypothetical protein